MPASNQSETVLKDRIVRYLRANGIVCWRAGAGPYTVAGIPDILGVLPSGRFLAIEAKRPGRYKDPRTGLTATQSAWLERFTTNNALALCVDALETVQAAIEPLLAP